MIKNIASLGDKKVSGIMTPRADLIAIRQDADLEEIKKIITTKGHTRIPIFKENLDEITGFIHSKDLSKYLCSTGNDFSINNILNFESKDSFKNYIESEISSVCPGIEIEFQESPH